MCKMTLKKWGALALALAISCSLSACGGDTSGSDSGSSTTTTAPGSSTVTTTAPESSTVTTTVPASTTTTTTTTVPASTTTTTAPNTSKGNVAYGTPQIDGVLDDLYANSKLTCPLIDPNFYVWGGGAQDDNDATMHFLWDENYLYMCAVVKDGHIVDDKEYVETETNSWQNDNIEVWIEHVDLGKKFKVLADAEGYAVKGIKENSQCVVWADMEGSKIKTTKTGTGYIIEIALKYNAYSAGNTLSLSLQVDDVDTNSNSGAASGSQSFTQVELVLEK